jgi:tRNA threonylcarbamoyladenosine biosynthesis protein TsaB
VTVLAIRTDKPQAELYLYDDEKKLGQVKWQAHRELSSTIHRQIDKILNGSSVLIKDVDGIVCFKGPGSFTGLRIGLTVANALAYAQNIPVVAPRGDDWLKKGINNLMAGKNDKTATPFYDRPATTTLPKK